jgi:putative resolvase
VGFGLNYITTLMEAQGRHMEAVFPDDTWDDLVNDFISIMTSMAARMYGRRGSKRRAERMKRCVEQVMKEEDQA